MTYAASTRLWYPFKLCQTGTIRLSLRTQWSQTMCAIDMLTGHINSPQTWRLFCQSHHSVGGAISEKPRPVSQSVHSDNTHMWTVLTEMYTETGQHMIPTLTCLQRGVWVGYIPCRMVDWIITGGWLKKDLPQTLRKTLHAHAKVDTEGIYDVTKFSVAFYSRPILKTS